MTAPDLPFALPKRLAWTLAVACALLGAGAVGAGVAGIEPSLVLHLSPTGATRDTQVFLLRAEPRGGETIARVRLEFVTGEVDVLGRTEFIDLPPDNAALFTLRIRRDAPEDPLLRVVQEGRVRRSYDVRLPVDR